MNNINSIFKYTETHKAYLISITYSINKCEYTDIDNNLAI